MGLVETLSVVESEVVTETDPGFSAVLICFQIYLLVLYCPPQPLYEQVVIVASLPIHTDFHSMLLQETGKCLAGELCALVGVADIRLALLESLLHSLYTEAGVQGVG